MELSLIITDNCIVCKRSELVLKDIIKQMPKLSLKIINVGDYKKNNIIIVPALLINDELFSYGDIDESKLLKAITIRQKSF